MKFINKPTGLELIISDELVRRIADFGIHKYPKEFGGLLVGRYTDNNRRVVIDDTILPKRYRSSRNYFERRGDGIREALEMHYNATPSLIYVGEWHTHPDNSATPSLLDIKAMTELASDKNVLITNPVLMILEIRNQHYTIGLYFVYNNKLVKYDPVGEEDEIVADTRKHNQINP